MKRSKIRVKSTIGHIETLINDPGEQRRGLAFIAHPHPLHGGTIDNKVVLSLAQTCYEQDYVAIRPNFRGVGRSDGEYTGGSGETEDMLELIAFIRGHYDASLPIVLAGFSFGGYVQHLVAQQLNVSKLILIGPAVSLYEFGSVPANTTVIHGINDEVVPHADAQTWAHNQGISFHTINDTGHFFHGKLAELKSAVLAACQ